MVVCAACHDCAMNLCSALLTAVAAVSFFICVMLLVCWCCVIHRDLALLTQSI